jgi:ring-1,2-phenylacetyl-CoA epoxidase subunit PaaC
MTYHLRHSAEWVIRLGDGTDMSRERMAAAIDEVWSYTGELFEMDAGEHALLAAGVAPDRQAIHARWRSSVADVLREATLSIPKDGHMQRGGREGRHTEHLGHMLAEMQVLARQHPGARW